MPVLPLSMMNYSNQKGPLPKPSTYIDYSDIDKYNIKEVLILQSALLMYRIYSMGRPVHGNMTK